MTNRTDYQRMKPGESKKVLAIVQSRRDTQGKAKGTKANKGSKINK